MTLDGRMFYFTSGTTIRQFLQVSEIEVLAAVKALIVVFQVVTPCCLIGGYQCFGGIDRKYFLRGSADIFQRYS
jgi:hypothetical protein